MNPKAQASIESLIVICALLGLLAASVSAVNEMRSAAAFAIDAANAKAFTVSAQEVAGRLSALGDGSEFTIRAHALGSWDFRQGDDGCAVKVRGTKEKQFALSPEIACRIPQRLSGKFSVRISKENGTILLAVPDR